MKTTKKKSEQKKTVHVSAALLYTNNRSLCIKLKVHLKIVATTSESSCAAAHDLHPHPWFNILIT